MERELFILGSMILGSMILGPCYAMASKKRLKPRVFLSKASKHGFLDKVPSERDLGRRRIL